MHTKVIELLNSEDKNNEKPNIKTGIYRHYKGNLYLVRDVIQHSETKEWLVYYQQLYGDCRCWVRPASMWSELTDDGKIRFTSINIDKK